MKQTRLYRFSTAAVAVLLFSIEGPAVAQMIPSRFNFDVGGGLAQPVGSISRRILQGWNMQVGGGINFNPNLGITLEYMYNGGMGVDRNILNSLNVPDGNAHVWGLTLNPTFRFGPREGRLGGYVVAGGGFYRRTVEFTQPTTAFVPFFDPWFGFTSFPVAENEVIGSVSKNAGGVDGSLGVTYALGGSGAKFFAEARYHWIDTPTRPTTIVPITFGIRW